MKRIKQFLKSATNFLKQILKKHPKPIISIFGVLVVLTFSGIVTLFAHENKVKTPEEENSRVIAEVTATPETITTPITAKAEITTTPEIIEPESQTTPVETTAESPETIKPEKITTPEIIEPETPTTPVVTAAETPIIKTPDADKTQTQQKPDPKPEPTNVTLSLNTYKIRLEIGKTATIIPTVTPGGASVSWESGEESIASVKNGEVTGIGIGATAIIVKVGAQEQRCIVIVIKPAFPFAGAQHYVDYAIAYGKSVGLKYDSTLNVHNAGWDQPIELYDQLSDEQMKLTIRHACEGFLFEGREHFGVQAIRSSENPYFPSDDEKSYQLFMLG